MLDIGGESSRPGALPVSVEDEWRRIAPVLQAALTLGCPVSVDTAKPEIMQRALDVGVDIVNDIKALQAPGAEAVVSAHPGCGVCLMHMQGEPRSMQASPDYVDVVSEVVGQLRLRVAALRARGIDAGRIVVDPGIGFGKTVEHNLELLRRQTELQAIGHPVLTGWSRKSTLGKLTGRPVDQRLPASLAAGLAAVQGGARILRVHDVAATVDTLKVWQAAGLC